jgi:tRNA(fMet)-specific endonuclease VapC
VGSLIDADALIAAERGRVSLTGLLESFRQGEFAISVVTASELLHGLHRANDPSIRTRREEFVENVLQTLPVIPIDLEIARKHAALSADLTARGQIIGPHDLWIAATCLVYNLALITGNIREFERVPGLQIEIWPKTAQHP